MFLDRSTPWHHGKSLDALDEAITCTEGSSWYEECNQCHCTSGVGVCTLIGCISDFSHLDGTCEGNSKWKKDCNWCHCVQGKGICTQMNCPIEGVRDVFLFFFFF